MIYFTGQSVAAAVACSSGNMVAETAANAAHFTPSITSAMS